MLPPCRIDLSCMRIQTFTAECFTAWATSHPPCASSRLNFKPLNFKVHSSQSELCTLENQNFPYISSCISNLDPTLVHLLNITFHCEYGRCYCIKPSSINHRTSQFSFFLIVIVEAMVSRILTGTLRKTLHHSLLHRSNTKVTRKSI